MEDALLPDQPADQPAAKGDPAQAFEGGDHDLAAVDDRDEPDILEPDLPAERLDGEHVPVADDETAFHAPVAGEGLDAEELEQDLSGQP